MSLITSGDVDPQGVAATQRLIDESHIASADYRDQTPSTNTAAMNDLRDQQVDPDQLPRLYLTDQQTAGRGRHGRTWVSRDQSLTFSLLVQSEATDVAMLPITVGVAIARAIEFSFAPLKTRLKWPNDVYVDGGKVAGVLVETTLASPNQFVLGIGVNVNETPELPTDDQQTAQQAATPKSIAAVIGRAVDRFDLLETIVQQVQLAINEPSHEVVADFRQRCWLTGFDVRFESHAAQMSNSGTCHGIDDQGQLMVEVDGQPKAYSTGEVHRMRLV